MMKNKQVKQMLKQCYDGYWMYVVDRKVDIVTLVANPKGLESKGMLLIWCKVDGVVSVNCNFYEKGDK